jgi:hypothetical protein
MANFSFFLFSFLHQVEINHQPELNFQQVEPLAHGKPPHAILHWENLVPFLATTSGSKPVCASIDRTNK